MQRHLDPGIDPDFDPDPLTRPRATRPAGRRGLRSRLDDLAVVVAVRTGVSPRAVFGLLLVTVLALAVLGARLAVVRARAVPVLIAPAASATVAGPSSAADPPAPDPLAPDPPTSVGSAPASLPVPGGPATGGPASLATAGDPGVAQVGGSGQVVVHVVGQVRRPGVVALRVGSRVREAVAAAGGATGRADLAAINLARPLVDGEQILVPKPGQQLTPAPVVPPGVGGGAGPGSPGAGPGVPVVDLNTATMPDLDALSGIGPVLAQRILDWRAQNGRFTSVEELAEVSGIGEATLERIRAQVRV
jgi:competence protein ComEA